MKKRWTRWNRTALAAAFAALVLSAPCALATESHWAYRQERAAERRYQRLILKQERAQRQADRKYERAKRRIERAAEREAYRNSQRSYRREHWPGYRERIF